MAMNSSPDNEQNPDELAETPPNAQTEEAQPTPKIQLTDFILKDLEAREKMKNDNKNQNLARNVVAIIIASVAVMAVVAFVFTIVKDDPSSIFDKTFTLIQTALFTMLGFLFGEKSNKKNS